MGGKPDVGDPPRILRISRYAEIVSGRLADDDIGDTAVQNPVDLGFEV